MSGAGWSRVTHAFATLLAPEGAFSFDLHVLGTPPAFILSQDRTLILNVKAEAFKFFPIQNSLSFVLSVVLLRINSRDLLIA